MNWLKLSRSYINMDKVSVVDTDNLPNKILIYFNGCNLEGALEIVGQDALDIVKWLDFKSVEMVE